MQVWNIKYKKIKKFPRKFKVKIKNNKKNRKTRFL